MPENIAHITHASSTVSFQDQGRFGHRRLGIAPAGVLDRASAQQANLLLGNHPHDPLIEIGPGGLELELKKSTWLALSGCASSRELPPGYALELESGTRLRIQGSPEGLWSYLAAPEGWLTGSSFGSVSFHSRSGVGPALSVGDPLSCHGKLHLPNVKARFLPEKERLNFHSPPRLRLHPGPHFSQFPKSDQNHLISQDWQISALSDRSGYRLEGIPLKTSFTIPSLPVLVGSLQIPPSGKPIVTLNDGPTVGGYPIIGLIEIQDLPWLVQGAPGAKISFS